MILEPEVQLQQNVNYYEPAIYHFDLSERQQSYVRSIFKTHEKLDIAMNIQFLQSANILNGNSIRIYGTRSGTQVPFEWTITLTGTYYSITEFVNDLKPQLELGNLAADVYIKWEIDQSKLQNQQIFSLKVIDYEGYSDINLEMKGYQILSILGMDKVDRTANHRVWTHLQTGDVDENYVEGDMICFMPLVKQVQVECSLQKDLMLCQDDKLRPMIANLINSVLQGDYAAFENNIQISPVDFNSLVSGFDIKFYDQNFMLMPELQELRMILQFNAPKQDGRGIYKGRFITNRNIYE